MMIQAPLAIAFSDMVHVIGSLTLGLGLFIIPDEFIFHVNLKSIG
jgi:hypothetical protein